MLALLIALAAPASAQEGVYGGFDVSGTARYVDNIHVRTPEGFGLSLGARFDVDMAAQIRVDARYVEGKIFENSLDRWFDVSIGARTPRLLVFSLDLHEAYVRGTSRLGDTLAYGVGGLGLGGRGKLGDFTVRIGGIGLAAGGVNPSNYPAAGGPFVGAEWRLGAGKVLTGLRAGSFLAVRHDNAAVGLITDGDLTLRFPVGKAAIGPRLDVSYRNFGLWSANGDLFGQRQEVAAHLGFAVIFAGGLKDGGGTGGGGGGGD